MVKSRAIMTLALGGALVALQACGGSTEPSSAAASMTVTPGAVNLTSLNATQQLTATVFSQGGDTLRGAQVNWATDNAAVATVSTTGLVQGIAVGTARITATSGSVSIGIQVTVTQVVTQLTKLSGDNQTGTAGSALPLPITARFADALGTPARNLSVSFVVSQGGGSVSSGTGTTNNSGEASVTWTLGTTAGVAQEVTVTATGSSAVVMFNANAQAGPVASVAVVSGNNQNSAPGIPLGQPIVVKVSDQHGNGRSGQSVTFAVTAGEGSVSPTTATTDPQGLAQTTWTAGSPGTNTATATATGTAFSAAFTANVLAVGPPANITVVHGQGQTALVGYATNVRPAVRVTDSNGLAVAGATVTFSAIGGGSVTGGTVVTSASGLAQVGSWVVGATAGAYTLQASVSGVTPATITATGQTAQFNIEIRNIGPPFTAPVQAAFDSAKAYWERIIYGDLSDVQLTNVSCGGQILSEPVDDILILANFEHIDGPGGVLGSAGWCAVRLSNALPIVGSMRFDTADVAGMVTNGTITAVILHEMGHVLGFSSSIFTYPPGQGSIRNCAQDLSSATAKLDTYFSCPIARAAFDSIGGLNYTQGQKVPLENCLPPAPSSCGAGTWNSHWRDVTFGNELMTGYVNSNMANPLSVLTIAAFEDLGYRVNYAVAQPYSRTFTAPAASRGPRIWLGGDVMHGPIQVVDDVTGRVVQVIQP